MPHPLIAVVGISLDDACSDTEALCNWTLDQTGNTRLANLADWLVGKPVAVAGLILIGLVIRWFLHRLIDRVTKRAEVGMLPDRISRAVAGGRVGAALNLNEDAGYTRRVQRAQTMGSLLKSLVSGVVFVVVALMFVSELGYDIAPLIASAGIIGVALGFGSQALVKDFLSGMFMIFEDQYGVGDEVDLGEASGTVEAVSLRVTRLRDVNGTVWYVRNGEIVRVGNMSQNWARTVLDIRVAYGEDLARVQGVLAEVAHDLWLDEDFTGRVIEEPSVWGVQDLGDDAVLVRLALKTAPLAQWAVAREMRARIKARFDHEGIEMPFAQRSVWMRENERPQPQNSTESEQPAASGPAQDEAPAQDPA